MYFFSFLFQVQTALTYSRRRRVNPVRNVHFSFKFKQMSPTRLVFSEKGDDERIIVTNHGCAAAFQILLYRVVRDNSRSGSHEPQLNLDLDCSTKHVSQITKAASCPHLTFPHVQIVVVIIIFRFLSYYNTQYISQSYQLGKKGKCEWDGSKTKKVAFFSRPWLS